MRSARACPLSRLRGCGWRPCVTKDVPNPPPPPTATRGREFGPDTPHSAVVIWRGAPKRCVCPPLFPRGPCSTSFAFFGPPPRERHEWTCGSSRSPGHRFTNARLHAPSSNSDGRDRSCAVTGTTWLGSDRGRRDGQLAAENFGPEDVPQMLVMLGNAAFATSVPNMQRARPAPSTLRNPETGGFLGYVSGETRTE